MTTKHHTFSPSSLERRSLCSGSWKMERGLPDIESEEATEGTYLHKCVELGTVPEDATAEQQDAVQRCLDFMQVYAPFEKWDKEYRVLVLDGFDELTRGIIDAVVELDDKIVAVDWKFGRNEVESADTNLQVQAYACGLLQSFMKPVEFYIYQPRLNKTTSAFFALTDEEIIVEDIKDIIHDCTSSGMDLQPSEKACMYCKAQKCGVCPACKELVESTEIATIESCSELTTEVLSGYLDQWRIIKKIGSSLENQARERLLKGEKIEGYTLKSRKGSRKCTDSTGVYNTIKNVVSMDEFLECIDVSLAKLEDKFARKQKEANGATLKQAKSELAELINGFVERKADSYQLTKTK